MTDVPQVTGFLERVDHYADTIDTAVACLQGRDRGAVARARRAGYFPPPLEARSGWATQSYYNLRSYEADLGPLTRAQRDRLLASSSPLSAAFGRASETDEVVLRASIVLSDLAAVIRRAIEPEFELAAYAERLSDDCATFDALQARLRGAPGRRDRYVGGGADELARIHQP